MNPLRCSALLLALVITSTAFGEMNVTTKQGQSVPVEVVSVAGRLATISRNNVKSTIKLDLLTEASQADVIAAAKAKGAYTAFPPLKATVIVGTKSRVNAQISYKKDMTVSPQLKLSAVSMMDPIPALDAIMVIIAQDTEAKYVNKKERYVIHATETKPIISAADGKMRAIDFEESMLSFDVYRDASNVGGLVYKYYLFALRDPETKKLLDFQTNHPQLPAYLAKNPDKKDELLGLGKGKEFPADFK
jgi:hypothetical protein